MYEGYISPIETNTIDMFGQTAKQLREHVAAGVGSKATKAEKETARLAQIEIDRRASNRPRKFAARGVAMA